LPGEHRLRRQPLPSQTVQAVFTRQYVPGDPWHHIHWPTTARRREPFVKIFQPEATSSVWLIPDFDRAAHLSQGDDATEDLLMLLTASLAHYLLHHHQQVGLLAHGAELKVVLPEYTPAHFWQIVTALASLNADTDRPLAQTLRQAQHLAHPRSLLILITPSLAADWPDELMHLTALGRRAEVFMIDPASFGGSTPVTDLLPRLTELGMRPHIVRRGEIKPVRQSAPRRWKFRTLGTGRAVAQEAPHGATLFSSKAVKQVSETEEGQAV